MRKALGWVIVIAALLTVWVFWEAHRSATTMITTRYEVTDPVEHEIRIAVLSDLHNYTFGEDNEDLVDTIRNEKPDLIFMIGDMLNEDEDMYRQIQVEFSARMRYHNQRHGGKKNDENRNA